MCGRFTLATPASKLIELFRLRSFPQFSARFNIAPSQLVICIRAEDRTARTVDPMRWGLVPSWAKDETIGSRMINARSETAAEKPSFRRAFKSQRCLIPADGFYEWEKIDSKTKQPWFIQMQDEQPFAFAGLWETWTPNRELQPNADPVLSCTILTTTANADLNPLHERMPVFVAPQDHDLWLSEAASRGQLQELMRPLDDGLLKRHRVSTTVNSPRNDSAACRDELTERPAPPPQQGSLFD